MASLLIDTHVFLWLLTDNSQLSQKMRQLCSSVDTLLISSISLVEISHKVSRGKLLPIPDIDSLLIDMKITVLPYIQRYAGNYRIYSQGNLDPFDNMLVSLALSDSLAFMTADRKILALAKDGLQLIDARR